jgi:hypothetical protein
VHISILIALNGVLVKKYIKMLISSLVTWKRRKNKIKRNTDDENLHYIVNKMVLVDLDQGYEKDALEFEHVLLEYIGR